MPGNKPMVGFVQLVKLGLFKTLIIIDAQCATKEKWSKTIISTVDGGQASEV